VEIAGWAVPEARGRVERRRDRGQRKAARLRGRADLPAAQLHRQRRKRGPEFPGACPEPARAQSCAVVSGPPTQAAVGRTRTRPRPTARSPRGPPRLPPAARPARTPEAAHGSPGTGRSAPWAPRSSGSGQPPGNAAGNQTRTHQRPSARRVDRAGDLHLAAAARLASTASEHGLRCPRATHRLGSLPGMGGERARRDSSHSAEIGNRRPHSGPTRMRHRQPVRLDTQPRLRKSSRQQTIPLRSDGAMPKAARMPTRRSYR
jgi:hypothetical protein